MAAARCREIRGGRQREYCETDIACGRRRIQGPFSDGESGSGLPDGKIQKRMDTAELMLIQKMIPDSPPEKKIHGMT